MKYQVSAFLILLLTSSSIAQAQPSISDLNLRGVQIGATTELNISGQGLAKGTKVFLPFPVEQQTVEENGKDELKVLVKLGNDIQPGLYPLRVFNADGLSKPVLVGVDRLPHAEFNNKVTSLPVALSGKLAGARILKSSFEAKKGQLLVMEVEANRLGGKLRPVLHLYNQSGKQVAFSQPSRYIEGDARCMYRVEEDGTYDLELHDFLFRGSSPGHFRLKIGDFEYADLMMPVAITVGQKTAARLIKIDTESEFLEEVVPGRFGWSAAKTTSEKFSGKVPSYLASRTREFVEAADGAANGQKVGSVPVGINGRLSTPREIDRYLLEVQANQKLTFDLLARRIGSPLDGKIRLTNLQGNLLAQNDDRKGEQDALLNYQVPDGVKQLIVEVSDVAGLGSKSHVYRLGIYMQNRPVLEASVDSNTIQMAGPGTVYLPVKLKRTGYIGPVALELHGLPDGYRIEGNSVAAGSDLALMTITATQAKPAVFSIDAVIRQKDQEIRFEVLAPENEYSKGTDVSRRWIAIGPATSRGLQVKWQGVPQDGVVSLGGQLPTEVTVNRNADLKGPLRVRLVSNQKTPKKRIRKDNKDTFVDDVENTIRAMPVELAENQQNAKLEIRIPNGIAEQDWQCLVVAELLSADKKQVIFSAACPPVTLKTQRLAQVKLSKGKSVQLPRSGVAKLPIAGSITRNGHQLPCRVSITGLPKGVQVVETLIAGDQDQFDHVLEIPVNAELLKKKSLALEFSFFDGKQPERVIGQAKSQKIKVSVEPPKKEDAKKEEAKKKAAK